MRRVVVTGAGGITALGDNWPSIRERLAECRNAVRYMEAWRDIESLNTRLGAPIEGFELPDHYTRVRTRTMGRNAKLAVRATEMALDSAGLLDDPVVRSGRMGVAYGSSAGSPDAAAEMVPLVHGKSARGVNATTYVRLMSHTAAANIGIFFGTRGRVIPTTSACTAGSQGIGYAYEAIKYGLQDLMIAGGSEEICASQAGVFDILYATSTRNDEPERTPRPFDRDRDGLVIGEGATTLVLESLEHAQARGAHILAEIKGFATNSDGNHVTRPTSETMGDVMEMALADAGIEAGRVGYVCAHGTATRQGDIAESQATERVFGSQVPVSSLKGYVGHTLGACGAMEAWWSIMMMNDGWFAPNLNLEDVDTDCGRLDYIRGEPRELRTDVIVSNNFAFGGINTSLVLGQV
ncbi:beta-ketoacyl-ACP synthase [Marinihelvus fidelis]|uniref:Beta-ketoacyl-ACP synthase n=1 Tax=Marinihelvus fidelis TaxID=2613842 RepID=A0A5N0TAE6_9GAMM|nr:beta-ketoacyl-ACP synthase [Marinihelvus fidelis]KAA9131394.1 beta-ketoacyl-ACP synthase [Marinihelvus fidelis]